MNKQEHNVQKNRKHQVIIKTKLAFYTLTKHKVQGRLQIPK